MKLERLRKDIFEDNISFQVGRKIIRSFEWQNKTFEEKQNARNMAVSVAYKDESYSKVYEEGYGEILKGVREADISFCQLLFKNNDLILSNNKLFKFNRIINLFEFFGLRFLYQDDIYEYMHSLLDVNLWDEGKNKRLTEIIKIFTELGQSSEKLGRPKHRNRKEYVKMNFEKKDLAYFSINKITLLNLIESTNYEFSILEKSYHYEFVFTESIVNMPKLYFFFHDFHGKLLPIESLIKSSKSISL